MIHYRTFRNSDTRLLVDVWRAQSNQRGVAQPISVELFEQIVLAKPYFDNAGLVLALDDKTPVGFVHAGFGPPENGVGLNTRFGVTSVLMLRPDYQQPEIGAALLARSEAYLAERGAEVLYAGGIRPLDPFYFGLYGGSELPGVLASAPYCHAVFQAGGYREIDRTIILHRELNSFRPPMDRNQMQLRRTAKIEEIADPPPRSWWEACALNHFQALRFDLVERDSPAPTATARVWLLDTFSPGWGVQAAGLYDLEVAAARQRQGVGTHLIGEVFRRLATQGIALVEAQTMQGNFAARALYRKLGFQEVDQGIVYRK